MTVHWPWQLCSRAVMWPTAFSSLYSPLLSLPVFLPSHLSEQFQWTVLCLPTECLSLGNIMAEEFPWRNINPKALDKSPGALQCSAVQCSAVRCSDAQPRWPFKCKAAWVSAAAWQPCLTDLAYELCYFLIVNLFIHLFADCFHVQNKRNIFAISTFLIQVWVLIVTIFYPLLQKNVLFAQLLFIHQVFKQMDPCLPWSLKI